MSDLNALESFVQAAETLNFSRVAAQRNTVQSAVSAHIRKLEEDLGRKLFDRGRGRAMSLTDEGKAYLVYARRILALADEGARAVRRAPSSGSIRLGTTTTLAMSVVPEALRAFARRVPGVQVQIDCHRSDGLLARLEEGEIDVACMMDQGRHQVRTWVDSMPLIWAAGPGFALQGSEDVPMVFLTDGRDLRGYAFDALDRVNRRGYLAHLSPHPVGVRALVLAGLAVTVMPRATVSAPLRDVGAEAGLPPLRSVALAFYRRPADMRYEVSVLAETLAEALGGLSAP